MKLKEWLENTTLKKDFEADIYINYKKANILDIIKVQEKEVENIMISNQEKAITSGSNEIMVTTCIRLDIYLKEE